MLPRIQIHPALVPKQLYTKTKFNYMFQSRVLSPLKTGFQTTPQPHTTGYPIMQAQSQTHLNSNTLHTAPSLDQQITKSQLINFRQGLQTEEPEFLKVQNIFQSNLQISSRYSNSQKFGKRHLSQRSLFYGRNKTEQSEIKKEQHFYRTEPKEKQQKIKEDHHEDDFVIIKHKGPINQSNKKQNVYVNKSHISVQTMFTCFHFGQYSDIEPLILDPQQFYEYYMMLKKQSNPDLWIDNNLKIETVVVKDPHHKIGTKEVIIFEFPKQMPYNQARICLSQKAINQGILDIKIRHIHHNGQKLDLIIDPPSIVTYDDDIKISQKVMSRQNLSQVLQNGFQFQLQPVHNYKLGDRIQDDEYDLSVKQLKQFKPIITDASKETAHQATFQRLIQIGKVYLHVQVVCVTLTLTKGDIEMKEVLNLHDFYDYIKIFESKENPLKFIESNFQCITKTYGKKQKNMVIFNFKEEDHQVQKNKGFIDKQAFERGLLINQVHKFSLDKENYQLQIETPKIIISEIREGDDSDQVAYEIDEEQLNKMYKRHMDFSVNLK